MATGCWGGLSLYMSSTVFLQNSIRISPIVFSETESLTCKQRSKPLINALFSLKISICDCIATIHPKTKFNPTYLF